MKIVENENAVKIIKALIPSKILDLNPVIAGGAIVGLYYLAIRHSSPSYDKDLDYKINRAISNRVVWKNTVDDLMQDLGLGVGKKFDDVDLFFLEDNLIRNPDHVGFNLLKDFEVNQNNVVAKSPAVYMWSTTSGGGGAFISGTSSGGGGGLSSSSQFPTFKQSKNRFSDAEKEHANLFSQFGLAQEIENSSYWANTYVTDLAQNWVDKSSNLINRVKIQMIKRKYSSIEELFSKFDLLNCCAAYFDGKFYFDDNFEQYADEHILKMGNSFVKPTVLGKIWSSTRVFKYAQRYSLEVSKEICDSLIETFIDAEILLEKIKGLDPNAQINLGEIESLHNPYGKNGIVEVNKLEGMIMGMYTHGPELFSMKHFDKDKLLLFVDSKHPSIKDFVRRYLESQSEEYQQKKINPLY